MLPAADSDALYRETLLSPLRACADYRPAFGTNASVTLEQFRKLYGADPLYHWIGLDSSLMYAAHKAAGGITSVYRQLGIGCERMVRRILRETLDLRQDQVVWSYDIVTGDPTSGMKKRTLSLDGRVEIDDVASPVARQRLDLWLKDRTQNLGISVPIKGLVIEVRQGYKSADSKRQNADLANAAQAIGQGYLPVLMIMSNQVNQAVKARYAVGNWTILTGTILEESSQTSTFQFFRDVVGYDLQGFFERNTDTLRRGIEKILESLLGA